MYLKKKLFCLYQRILPFRKKEIIETQLRLCGGHLDLMLLYIKKIFKKVATILGLPAWQNQRLAPF